MISLQRFWVAQQVGDEIAFLSRLKQNMVVKFKAWRNLQKSERYMMYQEIESTREEENYSYALDKRVFRNVFIRFRFGVTELYIHKRRYDGHSQNLCPLCIEDDEDELHFLLQCPALHDLRTKYVMPHVHTCNESDLSLLLSQKTTNTIRSVAIYLHYAFRRDEAIQLLGDHSDFCVNTDADVT